MTCHVLVQSQDAFFSALQTYLETYKLQTATAAKLWSSVASSTGADVESWMYPWTYRSGFPLLTVSLQGLDVLVTQVCCRSRILFRRSQMCAHLANLHVVC